MFGNLPAGSRAPVYVSSTETVLVDVDVVDTAPRTDDRDASPPPRPPLPAGAGAGKKRATMPRVSITDNFILH